MAAAPHDVPVFFQGEQLPEVMGEVIMGNDGAYVLTTNHYDHRVDAIKSKIRELYTLKPDDNIVPTKIDSTRIDYEIFAFVNHANRSTEFWLKRFNRPKKMAGGKRRSTRKTKRRSTRRLKRNHR